MKCNSRQIKSPCLDAGAYCFRVSPGGFTAQGVVMVRIGQAVRQVRKTQQVVGVFWGRDVRDQPNNASKRSSF